MRSHNRPRVFSGIQPTGGLHLGNLLGAVKGWVSQLDHTDTIICIVDLHALTVARDPTETRLNRLGLAAALIAAGVDPDRCILFMQSAVPEHAQLGWIMQCTASYGELSRMTQFKEKRERVEFISSGLFSYPALQAADILLYDTDEVPVGDDQRQHVELCRDLAIRFNNRFGETFVVPRHVIPPVGARVMDLANPTNKMSKSIAGDGTIWLSDTPEIIRAKCRGASMAGGGQANIADIFAAISGAATDQSGETLAESCAEAVIDLVEPIRLRSLALMGDPAELCRILDDGAQRAREIASGVMGRVNDRVGNSRKDPR